VHLRLVFGGLLRVAHCGCFEVLWRGITVIITPEATVKLAGSALRYLLPTII
jgi:hypothetical protein